MIAGVPLYVNPTTGATGSDRVSLVLTQGTQSSAPISVDIQDLPSVASYGATPGQISHAALVFEALAIGQRINDLQAFQALPGNTVDTSAAQAALKKLVTPILNARSDVDSVTSNPSLVISGGVSTTSGSPVQFDATALDTMDRVNGVFLSEVLTLPASSSHLRSKASQARPQVEVAAFVEGMGLVTNLAGYGESMLTTLSSGRSFSSYTVSDYAKALATTVGTTLSTAGTFCPGNKLLGISGAVFSALPTIGTALGNDAAWVQGWVTGDTAMMYTAEQEMQEGQTEAWAAAASLTEAVVGSTSLENIFGLKAVTTGASKVLDMAALYNQTAESGVYAAINLQSVPISSTTPPSSSSQGIAIAQGTITVPGSTAQSGLDFCCFNDLGIAGIVDAQGNYESFIPLGAANTNYGNITLDATNPLTGATLGSETVDLSGLHTTTPTTLTTLTTSTTTPTTPPAAGTYVGSCNVTVGPITCCADGVCSTVPGNSNSGPFEYIVAPGVTLSSFDSAVCGDVDAALREAGCATSSCNYSASTSTSFTFNLSCTLPTVSGCTAATVTETCTASH